MNGVHLRGLPGAVHVSLPASYEDCALGFSSPHLGATRSCVGTRSSSFTPEPDSKTNTYIVAASGGCTKKQAVLQLTASPQKNVNGHWEDRRGGTFAAQPDTYGFYHQTPPINCAGQGAVVYRTKGHLSSQEQFSPTHFYNHQVTAYGGSRYFVCSGGVQLIDLPPI